MARYRAECNNTGWSGSFHEGGDEARLEAVNDAITYNEEDPDHDARVVHYP